MANKMLTREERKRGTTPFNGIGWFNRGNVRAVMMHRKIRANNLKRLKKGITSVTG